MRDKAIDRGNAVEKSLFRTVDISLMARRKAVMKELAPFIAELRATDPSKPFENAQEKAVAEQKRRELIRKYNVRETLLNALNGECKNHTKRMCDSLEDVYTDNYSEIAGTGPDEIDPQG